MQKIFINCMAILILLFTACQKNISTNLELPSIFNDKMVLQRNTEVPFWGKGNPGTKISIVGDWGVEASTIVDNDGKWKVYIETPSAGGPHTVEINTDNESITYNNVMSGEVWLCSGQSNMEMPIQGWPPKNPIKNSKEVINEANYSDIRMFNVARSTSLKPKFDVKGEWNQATSNNVKEFSATAYFFGLKLYEKLDIPIGLIHSSWGGTPAEAWTSKSHLKKLEDYKETISDLDEIQPKQKKLKQWLNKLESVNLSSRPEESRWKNLNLEEEKYSASNISTENWNTMTLPTNWEQTEVGAFDGIIWFRKEISIPQDWENKKLILELGPVDDMDVTYFNGNKVGSHETTGLWQKPRKYEIDSNLVQSGEATIAVCVMDNQGGGGIYGDSDKMKIYPQSSASDSIPLNGEWKYHVFAEYLNGTLYKFGADKKSYSAKPKLPFNLNSSTPTLLYNGMINPIIPYKVKGTIWYQGESNTGRPYQYKELFPTLIKCWRDKWDQDKFPFYYVQIAPYKYGENTKSQLLREAQLETMDLKNTGMVVTTDIYGDDPDIIHPPNKQDVGKRLARWALANDYNFDDTVVSGPIFKSMEKKENKIKLNFKYVGSGLITKGDSLKGFQIAGSDSSFHPAKAKIEDNEVLVWNSKVQNPKAVRYGWSNVPEINLFNKEGLPASPFRTDDWKINVSK